VVLVRYDVQLDRYLALLDRTAELWEQMFPHFSDYSLAYQQLFLGLYASNERKVTKGRAGELLVKAKIKSPLTHARIIAEAIEKRYVTEEKSPGDNRITFVKLTEELEQDIREYLCRAMQMTIEELRPMLTQG
jgi:DNA-binding MarR family transcriptional regulator